MKKQLFVILSVILILMAGFGAGIAAAEDSTNDSSASDDSTSDDSAGDSSGDNSISDNTADDSTSDDSAGDSTEDNSVSDDSTNKDSVDDSSDDTTADNSVNDDSANDDSTSDVSADDTTVDDKTPVYLDQSVNYGSDDDTNISSDDDTTYVSTSNMTSVDTDDDTIIANNNSTVYNGDTYISDDDTVINDNSTTIIKYIEKTQINIDNSQNVYYNVTNDNSVVNNIYFTPTKSSGTAKIVVEDLKDDKCLKVKPAGNIYKSFNIWIDNKDAANNMKNAAVDFKVEKSWLTANGLDKSSIVLNMYDNGKWIEVPITITSEDSKYIYFKAEVSRYSTFAITGKTVVVDKVTKQSDSQKSGNSDEEIDAPTKNVVIKLLELIIDLLKE